MTTSRSSVSALILAGRRPDGDPLAEANGARYKALLDVAGKPMIQHVLSALAESGQVNQVTIYTQEPEVVRPALDGFDASEMSVSIEPSASSISQTVLDHLDGDPAALPVLVTTADNPMLSPEAVRSFLNAAPASADLAAGLVSQHAVEQVPVETKRTWLRFADQSVTGCNLFLLRTSRVRSLIAFWRTLEQQRKKVNHLARRLGLVFLLRYRCGWISLAGAFEHISKRFGLAAEPVVLDDGRLAIDADHQADLDAIRSLKAGGDVSAP